MGQYYHAVFLRSPSDKDKMIICKMIAHDYRQGVKLMEHSYLGTGFPESVMYQLTPEGLFHHCRVVWAGHYADAEPETSINLFLQEAQTVITPFDVKTSTEYPFLINHTKKLYVDCRRALTNLHPLP